MRTRTPHPEAGGHPSPRHDRHPSHRRHRLRAIPAALLAGMLVTACGGGGGSSSTDSSTDSTSSTTTTSSTTDITAQILANEDVTLAGDAVISLPSGTTTYTGVISGAGTLRLTPAGGTSEPGTLVITKTSTFTLPAAQQVETVTKTTYAGEGYALDITGTNPPVLTIDAGATLRLGTNSSSDDTPNILAVSDSLNDASVVNGEVNLDNILNNGAIEIDSAGYVLLGEVSGTGSINELADVWGGESLGGTSAMTGVMALSTGQDFGSDHVAAGLSGAKAVLNEGSWLLWCPPAHVVTISQDIYEAAYGNDINFHAIGSGRIVMTGVYSHTDNSPHGTPNLTDPGLSDASLNYAKVIYRGTNSVNGNDASYRGINIEGGNVVQWGDGTTSDFFLPSAPSPADVSPSLGAKNAYINLRSGGTLAFDYDGAVQLNVGITGGGGGPHKDGSVGVGNVVIMGTSGNDVTFAQPQNYNGTTTIESGAVLRLGAGTTVPLNYVTIKNGVASTALVATYSGDASLLTAQSTNGASTDAIVDDGQLIVQNTTTAITLSQISGTGSFKQAGAAATTLQDNSFSGGTAIGAGEVIAGDASAFGTGSVANSAALAVPSVLAVAVGGNYTQSSAATLTLAVEVGTGTASLVVAGSATLAGNLVLDFTGTPVSGQKYVLVSATGGLSGTFSSVTASGATVVAGHDATSYYVTVQ